MNWFIYILFILISGIRCYSYSVVFEDQETKNNPPYSELNSFFDYEDTILNSDFDVKDLDFGSSYLTIKFNRLYKSRNGYYIYAYSSNFTHELLSPYQLDLPPPKSF